MKIEIVDRLKLFSHSPGHIMMIPGTRISVRAFPSALIFIDEQGAQTEFLLGLKGPVDPFTVEQDLERREVRVYGDSAQGYFRLAIGVQDLSLVLRFEKTPLLGISLGDKTFFSGEVLEIMKDVFVFKEEVQERLFLGSSKQKESDLIRRRKDLREVFPLWHLLGSITPNVDNLSFSLLEEAIQKKDKKTVYDLFFHAYLAHFSPGLVPRAEDEEKQGLVSLGAFSRCLLPKGSSYIRSLFFQEKEDGFHILPCLLPLFVCGKMIRIKSDSGCLLDIEWTKHRLRRMHIAVKKDQILKLHFPSDVESFRIKTSLKDRGKIFPGKGSVVSVKAGDLLLFDLFQK